MAVLLSLVVPLALSSPPARAQVEQGPRTLTQAVDEVDRQKNEGPTAASICVFPVTISSRANGRYVSTELGYSGNDYAMLRARVTVPGPRELYQLCYYFTSDEYTLYSFNNNRYVTVETSYGESNYGMLRARATTVTNRERFRIQTGTVMTIRSVANNRFVSAELGNGNNRYAMLRARATSVGLTEQFQ
jgi:hypothetical protein